jgi:hypothetical protein
MRDDRAPHFRKYRAAAIMVGGATLSLTAPPTLFPLQRRSGLQMSCATIISFRTACWPLIPMNFSLATLEDTPTGSLSPKVKLHNQPGATLGQYPA